MLQQLIHDKINEIFAEYQQANNIISGDIEPFDAEYLDRLEEQLANHIERICSKQPKAINSDDFTPSWYVYTDCDGEMHSVTFGAEVGEDLFFTKVSDKICHDDLDGSYVNRIFYKGKEVFYAGWQPRMKYEFVEASGDTVWVGWFEDWDH